MIIIIIINGLRLISRCDDNFEWMESLRDDIKNLTTWQYFFGGKIFKNEGKKFFC